MSKHNVNSMRFYFCTWSGHLPQVCCCSLQIASYIMSAISIALSLIEYLNAEEKTKTISMISLIFNSILLAIYIYAITAKKFSLSYIIWIVITIFDIVLFGICIIGLSIILSQPYLVIKKTLLISSLIISALFTIFLNLVIYSTVKSLGIQQETLSTDQSIRMTQELNTTKPNSNLPSKFYPDSKLEP